MVKFSGAVILLLLNEECVLLYSSLVDMNLSTEVTSLCFVLCTNLLIPYREAPASGQNSFTGLAHSNYRRRNRDVFSIVCSSQTPSNLCFWLTSEVAQTHLLGLKFQETKEKLWSPQQFLIPCIFYLSSDLYQAQGSAVVFPTFLCFCIIALCIMQESSEDIQNKIFVMQREGDDSLEQQVFKKIILQKVWFL